MHIGVGLPSSTAVVGEPDETLSVQQRLPLVAPLHTFGCIASFCLQQRCSAMAARPQDPCSNAIAAW
jgi:hypothetical protein